nr:DUF2809 domain-containing protein [Motilimonas eburnea]
MVFSKAHFVCSTVLFAVLAYIALFVNDQFVRPFLGDVIVVVWLYTVLKSFLLIKSSWLAHFVLLFSYAVEVAQYFKLVSLLGLEHIKAVRIIFGATFDWLDLLAYTLGWLLILGIQAGLARGKHLSAPKTNH